MYLSECFWPCVSTSAHTDTRSTSLPDNGSGCNGTAQDKERQPIRGSVSGFPYEMAFRFPHARPEGPQVGEAAS